MAKISVTTKDGKQHKLDDAERKYIEQTKPPQFENGPALKQFLRSRPGGTSPAVLGFCSSSPAPA